MQYPVCNITYGSSFQTVTVNIASMSEDIQVTKETGIICGLTLLSRTFGFLRDAAMAWFFGAGYVSDVFFVAFRMPNMMRRLFSEGTLNLAFIPVFIDYLLNKGKAEAFLLARSAFSSLFFILTGIVLPGIVFAPVWIRVIAPGFMASPEKLSLAVFLARIMFPFIIFIGLSALTMGILNTMGHFAAPSLGPFAVNISIICSIFFISPNLKQPVTGLAVGVLVGGFLQLFLQLPFLIKKGIRFWQYSQPFHPGLRRVGLLTIPSAIGASVYQLSLIIDTLTASFLHEGAISHLYYADRLVQFPMGIFAIAVAIAALPHLAKAAAMKDYPGLIQSFMFSTKLVIFIIFPAMMGLIILREPIVSLLFHRGEFDLCSVRLTAAALLYYGVGLWAFSGVRITVSTFFAMQDTGTPFRIAIILLIIKGFMALVLVAPFGFRGLALSTSLTSVINLIILLRTIHLKLPGIQWRALANSVVKSLIGTTFMALGVWGAGMFILPDIGSPFLPLFLGVSGCIFIGIVIYMCFSFMLASTELKALLAAIGWKGKHLK